MGTIIALFMLPGVVPILVLWLILEFIFRVSRGMAFAWALMLCGMGYGVWGATLFPIGGIILLSIWGAGGAAFLAGFLMAVNSVVTKGRAKNSGKKPVFDHIKPSL